MIDPTELDPVSVAPSLEEFAALQARVEALEAWACRRPGDAIPQPLIDQITADAIANAEPAPADPAPSPEPTPEEVPGADDEDPGVAIQQ